MAKLTETEMDYLKRVKDKIDITTIKDKQDLQIQLSKIGYLGKDRQYHQLNIIGSQLDFKRVEKGEQIAIKKNIYKQTITRYDKPVNIHRDNKGRFVKYVE